MATIATANAEMLAAWDGEEGDDWTQHASRYEASGRYLAPTFDAASAIAETDVVLDVGCGTGRSTRDAARRARSGRVLGVDLSSRMLDHARDRSRAEGLTNVEYLQADAQVRPLGTDEFDVGMSSFGAMFFGDPVGAFGNIRRALRPGARLVLSAWQPFERQEWLVTIRRSLAAGRELPTPAPGQPGPFGLADDAGTRRVLEDAGFTGIELTPVEAPMWLGADADDAWEFVAGLGIVRGLSAGLEPGVLADALADLRAAVAAHATSDGVAMGAAEWIVTASA
jgi:SAM-dependent methyltransferase